MNRNNVSLSFSFFGRHFKVPVLMFHGLSERIPEYAIFPEGLTCLMEVEKFSELIAWCSKNFDILRLSDLDEYLNAKSGNIRPMILTFDDALASVIDLGLPILREHNASAVIFVTTEWTDSGCTPDIFLLERALWESVPANLVISIDSERLELEVPSRIKAPEVLTRVWNFLFEIRFPPLSLTTENILINGKPLSRQEVLEDRHFWFPASWEELREAAHAGMVEIGSHMVSHPPLPWLTDEDKLFQLRHSRDRLTRMTGSPVTACSYPHGSVDERTSAMAEEIYDWSFTNKPGRLYAKTSRGAAPRYHVPGEAPEMVRWILHWGYKISHLRKFGLDSIARLNRIFFH